MARARILKPDFFRSEEVGALSPLARLMFQGLWTVADRDGRLLDRPRRLRLELLPYDDGADGDALLSEIAGNPGLIRRYQAADGTRIIQITNFEKHQKPHFKEPSLGLPSFNAVNVGQSPGITRLLTASSGESRTSRPDPDLDPSSGSGSGSGNPPRSESGLPETPEAVFALMCSTGGALTGRKLAVLFGQVRVAEIPGSLPWSVPKNAGDRDAQAAEIDGDPEALSDVVPTMRLLFALAKAGKLSKAADVLDDPSFAFGVWCSQLTKLRERLRGIAPAATGPPATNSMYADLTPPRPEKKAAS